MVQAQLGGAQLTKGGAQARSRCTSEIAGVPCANAARLRLLLRNMSVHREIGGTMQRAHTRGYPAPGVSGLGPFNPQRPNSHNLQATPLESFVSPDACMLSIAQFRCMHALQSCAAVLRPAARLRHAGGRCIDTIITRTAVTCWLVAALAAAAVQQARECKSIVNRE